MCCQCTQSKWLSAVWCQCTQSKWLSTVWCQCTQSNWYSTVWCQCTQSNWYALEPLKAVNMRVKIRQGYSQTSRDKLELLSPFLYLLSYQISYITHLLSPFLYLLSYYPSSISFPISPILSPIFCLLSYISYLITHLLYPISLADHRSNRIRLYKARTCSPVQYGLRGKREDGRVWFSMGPPSRLWPWKVYFSSLDSSTDQFMGQN